MHKQIWPPLPRPRQSPTRSSQRTARFGQRWPDLVWLLQARPIRPPTRFGRGTASGD